MTQMQKLMMKPKFYLLQISRLDIILERESFLEQFYIILVNIVVNNKKYLYVFKNNESSRNLGEGLEDEDDDYDDDEEGEEEEDDNDEEDDMDEDDEKNTCHALKSGKLQEDGSTPADCRQQ